MKISNRHKKGNELNHYPSYTEYSMENGMIIVDANNLLYKCWFVMGKNDYYSIRQMFVTFLNNFANWNPSLVKVWDIYIVWDSSFYYWRKSIYPIYKKQRLNNRNKDDLKKLRDIRSLLKEHLSKNTYWRQLSVNYYEADDVIAELVRTRENRNEIIKIVSNDSDLYQLINEKNPIVFLKRLGASSKKMYGYREFVAEYGIKPKMLPYIKALAGDSSDNIPGVRGIGKKRAIEIIKKYGIFKNWLDTVKYDGTNVSKWAVMASEAKNRVRFYYKLVDLIHDQSPKIYTLDIKNNLMDRI